MLDKLVLKKLKGCSLPGSSHTMSATPQPNTEKEHFTDSSLLHWLQKLYFNFTKHVSCY